MAPGPVHFSCPEELHRAPAELVDAPSPVPTFLEQALARSLRIVLLRDLASDRLKVPSAIPVRDLVDGTFDGRSGTLAVRTSA